MESLQDASTGISPEQRHELIAAVAYRRYQARGEVPGDSQADWFEAEKEVVATLARSDESPESAKAAFVRALSTLLGDCQVQLAELAARASAAGEVLQTEYEQRLAIAMPRYEAVRARLVEIRAHTGEAWGHLRDGAEKAASEMRAAVREAAASLK